MASGSISGTVTNAFNDASLQGATVTVTNTGTGQTSTAQTDREGNFSLDQLPDGTYNLTATKSGYMDYDKEKLSPPVEDLFVPLIKKSNAPV
jgi:hypothetical protein